MRNMAGEGATGNEHMTLEQWLKQISTETRLDILMRDSFNKYLQWCSMSFFILIAGLNRVDPLGTGMVDLESLRLLMEELMIAYVGFQIGFGFCFGADNRY